MNDFPGLNVNCWLCDPVSQEVKASIQKIAKAGDVTHVAIMPDVHLANDVCIGTVVATTELIYPAAIGSDIGCGMAAVRFDCDASVLEDETVASQILSQLYSRVPSNRHSSKTMPVLLPEELMSIPLSDPRLEKQKLRDARVQLGTLGRGNHFLEFQADQKNKLWLMVHSGSRAMGQVITEHHLALQKKKSQLLLAIDCDSDFGLAYLNDVHWALQYAMQNRLAMIVAVADFLRLLGIKIDWSSLIHSHHNHVRRESHFGKSRWVHRKGTQSALQDEPGIIPGSMGTASFHVTGRAEQQSLCSCSHGAGRKMSRSQARKKISIRDFRQQMQSVFFDQRFATAMQDEAPEAYNDIFAVMRAQKNLIKIRRQLRPLLCYKGR